jgi:hypothetical protein
LWRRICRGAGLGALVPLLSVVLAVPVAAFDIGTIPFPDTVPGTSSTLACQAMIGLCFIANPGERCTGSGTVQSVSGPNPPFSVAKFNLLTLGQFDAGNCEANPKTLPVVVGPGQVLAFQGTFAPPDTGTYTSTVTLATPGGPATYTLTGQGVASSPDSVGRGLLSMELNNHAFVPGSFLDLSYRTRPGTLTGPVDLYLAVVLPSQDLVFLTDNSAFVPDFVPFRRNVGVADETQTLFSLPFPIDLQFGTYTAFMALVKAGADPGDPRNWASDLVQVTATYAPLSAEQQAVLAARGNPHALAATWTPEVGQKLETWIYRSSPPTRIVFRNGQKVGEAPGTGGPAGTGINPALFNPQATQAQYTASLGPPVSVEALDTPGYLAVGYANGVNVVLRDGRLSTAFTLEP